MSEILKIRAVQAIIYFASAMNFVMFMMWSNGPRHYPLWSVLGPIWFFEGTVIKAIFYISIPVFCIFAGRFLLGVYTEHMKALEELAQEKERYQRSLQHAADYAVRQAREQEAVARAKAELKAQEKANEAAMKARLEVMAIENNRPENVRARAIDSLIGRR